MGIPGLLGFLPGGKDYHTGFLKINRVGENFALDVAGLLWFCLYCFQDEYVAGNYGPCLQLLAKRMQYLIHTLKWNICVVLDGRRAEQKAPEYARRAGKLHNTSAYIAMAAKVCKDLFIPYIVAPEEADAQAALFIPHFGGPPTTTITGDSDLLAYGAKRVIVIQSWADETFRLFDMNVSMHDTENTMMRAYSQAGALVFHIFAACCGCDFTEQKSGDIAGVGPRTVQEVFGDMMAMKQDITIPTFAKAIVDWGSMLDKSLEPSDVETILERVALLFSRDAVIYDENRRIVTIGGRVVQESSETLVKHSQGELDPFTCEPFPPEMCNVLSSFDTNNVLHTSHLNPSDIQGFSLPQGRSSVKECVVAELRTMVTCRGGNGVSERGENINKPELVQIVNGFRLLEKEMPQTTVVFDRNPETNGLFLKCSDVHGRTIPSAIQDLLNEPALQSNNIQAKLIRDNVAKAQLLLRANKFISDYDAIAMTTPELKAELLYRECSYIGESVTQKNTGTSLSRVLGQSHLLYHANAFSDTRDTLWVVSKQMASMQKEKRKKEDKRGERPQPREYLVIMALGMEPPDDKRHGHKLGVLTHIKFSYCMACAAGLVKCLHVGKSLWVQFHHWGPTRPVERPPTMDFCRWLRKGTAHQTDVTTPVENMVCPVMPRSLDEAKERGLRKRMHNLLNGTPATYSVFSSDAKRQKAIGSSSKWFSPERMQAFLVSLRKPRKSNR